MHFFKTIVSLINSKPPRSNYWKHFNPVYPLLFCQTQQCLLTHDPLATNNTYPERVAEGRCAKAPRQMHLASKALHAFYKMFLFISHSILTKMNATSYKLHGTLTVFLFKLPQYNSLKTAKAYLSKVIESIFSLCAMI
jgi:hypothetical protein